MSVHLRVYAELNDFVKPDEQYTVLRRPFRPHQMESPERTEWPCVPDVDAVTVREPATRTAASDVGDGAGRGDVTIVRGNV